MSLLQCLFICLWLQPTDPDALLRAGSELAREGKDLEALRAFRKVVGLAPANGTAWLQIALILERNGNGREATFAFQRAAALLPDHLAAQRTCGEALYRLGRAEDAVGPLERSVSGASPVVEALPFLAGAYVALGRSDDGFEALRRYLALRPADYDLRLMFGRQLAGAKRYDEALAVWKEGLESGAKPAEFCFSMAETLARSRDGYPEATAYLYRALEAAPEHLAARLLLSRVLVRSGRVEEGLREAEKAAASRPDSADVQFQLASTHQQLGRTEDAERARVRFQTLTRESERREHLESRIKVTYKRGRELLDGGNMPEAKKEFAAVVELDPENALARSMLAKIAFSQGLFPEARRWIAGAVEKDGTVGEYYYLAGLFALRSGERSAAESAVRRALALAPGLADAWILLGAILADSSRPEEAVRALESAEALEPEDPAIQLNLSTAYRTLGRSVDADKALERYRSLTSRPGK